MHTLLPWATSIGTIIAMELIKRKRWWGWAVGLANQVIWITFAFAYHAYGLLPLSAVLSVVYTRALLAWRAESLEAGWRRAEPTLAIGDAGLAWRQSVETETDIAGHALGGRESA